MNQYAMISAQFPPIPANVVPSSASASTTIESEKQTTSDTKVDEPKSENEETRESNVADDGAPGPSTSQKSSSIETLEIDGNIVTIEDIGSNDPSDPNDPVSEVRRRRLQRFEARTQES